MTVADEEAKKVAAAEEGIKKEIDALRKLKKISNTPEFQEYFEFLKKTAAEKMVAAFTTDKIETWDDFLRLRGEIFALIFPVQEIFGADMMEKHLKTQLDMYYKRPE